MNAASWRSSFFPVLGSLAVACGGHTNDVTAKRGPDKSVSTDPSGATQVANDADGTSVATPPSTVLELPPEDARAVGPFSACLASKPYRDHGVDTGLERCQDGRLHRPAPVICPSKLPRQDGADAGVSTTDGGSHGLVGVSDPSVCLFDRDCTAKPLGHCEPAPFPVPEKLCAYGCLADADCGAGFVCQCGDPVGSCVAAACRSDADCADGLLCARGVPGSAVCITHDFSCETPEDGCRIDKDCSSLGDGYCGTTETARECFPPKNCGDF